MDRLVQYRQYLALYDRWREDGDFDPSDAMASLYDEAQQAVVWRAGRTSRWKEVADRPITGKFYVGEEEP